jgi:hypothetical protein
MGKFADIIMSEADWEKNWTPADLESRWFIYLAGPLAQASEALQGAPAESKERAIYDDAVAKVSRFAKLAGKSYDKTDQTDDMKADWVRRMLKGCDSFATLIESHGTLYLKALESERIFRGEWTPDGDTRVPEAHAEDCNTYNLKHFGVDRSAAWYLGRFEKNYKRVKALEEKAIESGLDVPGAYIFRFDEQLGWDGVNGARGTINTRCIRVDSVGSKQHSHPIPEEGTNCVSHQKLVCSSIVEAVENKDLERLVTIAKYLTLIGAGAREYRMPGQDLRQRLKVALQKEGATLPECKFWSD